MFDLSGLPLWGNIAVFGVAATLIAWGGTKLATLADQLADRTGFGEAITGTILLGFVTALPGLAASVTAALEGRPALAIANAIGGIAIQTTFLAVADLSYTKANLEHAAASVTNMIQTAILVALLALVLVGLAGPAWTVGHVSPVTGLILGAAGAGFWLVVRSSEKPMWQPRHTSATVKDTPVISNLSRSLLALSVAFVLIAIGVVMTGAVVAHTVGNIADATGISETLAGGLLSAIATSLPELVTTVAAVRQGALTLAVSDIVGGNFFDVLFVVAADLVYFQGSIFHAAGVDVSEMFLVGLAILINVTLLLGLLYRQRAGPANIGFESLLMPLLYIGGLVALSFLP